MAGAGVQDNWQSKLPNVLQRTTHLFNNQEMSDVSFIFKRPQDVPVLYGHKLILGMSSPIFYSMFYGDHSTCNNDNYNNNEIILMSEQNHKFDFIAFSHFIKFLYTDEIAWDSSELSVETIIGILHCSEFYHVPRLKTDGGKALLRRLTVQNVILFLETALHFNDKNLAEKCLEIIDCGAKTVFELETILDAKMETLFQIIRRDTLGVDESQVLDICLKWSVKECERKGLAVTEANKRQVLDKIFFEIRFPILPPIKFAELLQSNFLTQQESLDMLLYMQCLRAGDVVKALSTNLISEIPFKTEKRAVESTEPDRMNKVEWICPRCRHKNITLIRHLHCELCIKVERMLKQ